MIARINSALIRRINTARVFHVLREHPGHSQRQISALTGLDASTVSTVVGQLEASGVVCRSELRRSGLAGRPESTLRVDRSGGILIGVALEAGQISLIGALLDGERLGGLEVEGSADLDVALARLRGAVHGLLADLGRSMANVRAIGVGQHGLVDASGHLVLAPVLGWRDVPIAARLEALFPVPVRVENDTKAAALAEHLFGTCRGVENFVYILGGSGIGGALYLQAGVHRGAMGLAGELGHMKVVRDGRACGCGGHGCLEAYLSEHALLRRLAETGRPFGTQAEMVGAAATGDPVVLAVLEETGALLGDAIANLINVLNPSHVVLAGNLVPLAPYLLPAAKRSVAANALTAMGEGAQILVSQFGAEAVPMGGVGLAMEAFLPLPRTLTQAGTQAG
jgi:predicted NBD/HSP70 family sugar kinase